jgi:hypothetical protein
MLDLSAFGAGRAAALMAASPTKTRRTAVGMKASTARQEFEASQNQDRPKVIDVGERGPGHYGVCKRPEKPMRIVALEGFSRRYAQVPGALE